MCQRKMVLGEDKGSPEEVVVESPERDKVEIDKEVIK